jgi:hypothetical protein
MRAGDMQLTDEDVAEIDPFFLGAAGSGERQDVENGHE